MKQTKHTPSDEMLNAFVDSDMDSEDYREILQLCSNDADVLRRVTAIQHCKWLVREAYASVPRPAGMHSSVPHTSILARIASFLLIALISAATGWYAGAQKNEPALTALADNDSLYASDAEAVDGDQRIILHLSSADPQRMQASLDQAELILAGSEYDNNPPQVELIANGAGLAIFRTDITPFTQRISQLQAQYPSLNFYACAQAISQLEEQGIEVRILPGVDTGSTAASRIYTRSRQGWEYESI